MDAPPSYTDAANIDQKYPPTFQQPQSYSAFIPASTYPPPVQPGLLQAPVSTYPPPVQPGLLQAPVSSYPQTVQHGFPPAQGGASTYPTGVQQGFPQVHPVPGNSNIFMMGLLPYENVQTPSGVKMVRRVLGKTPSTLTCQFCNERVETKVEERSIEEMLTESEWRVTQCTWTMLLILSPLWLFIPLCIYFGSNPLSMTKHTCPRCNTCLGIHNGGADQFFYTAGSPEAQYAAAAAMMRQRRR